MSFPTRPAFVHYGDFDATTAKYPAMKWLEDYKDDFDSRTFDPKWYAPDFVYVAPDGQTTEGREKALDAIKALYGPLTAHWHEPFFLNCFETEYGYEMIGQATMWANLPGEPAAGETKKHDKNGKAWDVGGPGSFHFKFKKHRDSFQFTRTEIYADTGPIMMGMLRRGVLSPKDLGL
jgi:hypothetical protein